MLILHTLRAPAPAPRVAPAIGSVWPRVGALDTSSWQLLTATLQIATLLPLLGFPGQRSDLATVSQNFLNRRSDIEQVVTRLCERAVEERRLPITEGSQIVWTLLLLPPSAYSRPGAGWPLPTGDVSCYDWLS